MWLYLALSTLRGYDSVAIAVDSAMSVNTLCVTAMVSIVERLASGARHAAKDRLVS
jgi:hypothetical protein